MGDMTPTTLGTDLSLDLMHELFFELKGNKKIFKKITEILDDVQGDLTQEALSEDEIEEIKESEKQMLKSDLDSGDISAAEYQRKLEKLDTDDFELLASEQVEMLVSACEMLAAINRKETAEFKEWVSGYDASEQDAIRSTLTKLEKDLGSGQLQIASALLQQVTPPDYLVDDQRSEWEACVGELIKSL